MEDTLVSEPVTFKLKFYSNKKIKPRKCLWEKHYWGREWLEGGGKRKRVEKVGQGQLFESHQARIRNLDFT